ncbi:Uncharacterized protein BN1090_A2_01286 [Aneurinibacillus migulanus]|nr:Uncharacterized protein BN1090_A2_01286 [Aneurinibacillus migulanus]
MQYAFKYAAPVAKQLGISLEELAAATGIMSNSGIKGEQAGTSLRAALLRLADPPKAAANQLLDLGIKIEDAKGNMLPFSNIIGQVAKATEGMGTAQKSAALSTIFGTEAVSGMLALIEAGPEKIIAFSKELKNSDGAAAEAAQKMKDNLAGALEELGGAFETAQITIGDVLAPALRAVAESLQVLIDGFNNLPSSMQSFLAIGGAVSTILLGLIAALGLVAAGIGSFVSAFGTMAGVIGEAGGVTSVLATALRAITGPIGIAVSAIIAFGTAIAGVWKNSETLRNAIANGWSQISSTIVNALAPIRPAFDQLKGAFGAFMYAITGGATTAEGAFKKIGDAVGNFINSSLATALPVIKTAFEGISSVVVSVVNIVIEAFNGLSAFWVTYGTTISQAVFTTFDFVKTTIMQALDAVVPFVSTKLQELKTFWDQNGTQIIQAASNVWNAIKTIISTVMTALSPIVSVAWTGIKMIIQSVWESIKGVISGALNVIQGLIKVFSGVFTGEWSKVWEGVKQATSGAVQFLWNAIQLTLFGKVLSAAKVFVTGFKAAITAGWTAIKSIFTSSISAIQGVVTRGWNAIKAVSNAIMNGLRTLISSVWNGIRNTITSAITTIKTTVSTGFNSLKTSVTTAMNNVKTTITTIWNNIMAFFRGIDLKKVGSDIIGGLISGIMGKAGELYEKAKGIADRIESTIRKALDTHSPSRVMQKVGHDVGDGLALGISQKEKEVKKSSEKLAKQAEKAAREAAAKQKKAFDSSMKTAEYNFKMGKVDLSGYIKSLENIRKTQAKTTEQVQKVNLAIKKAETDLAKQLDEINKKKFEASKKWIDERKYYNELSLEQELASWERVAARYKKGTDERIEAEREIYRVKKEISQASFNNSKSWIDEQKYYNKLSLEEELAAWQRVQARYKKGTAERKEADREIYRVRLEIMNKAIEDEYKATVEAIDRANKAVQEGAERQKEAIESRRDVALDSLKREEKAEMDSLDRRQKAYERSHQERLKMLDQETDRAVKSVQAQIDAIDREAKNDDNAAKDADRNKKLTELQKQYDKYKVSASAKGQQKAADLLKQIQELQTEMERDQLARRREQEKEALKGQIEDIKEAANQKKEQWQYEFDRQKEWFEQEKEQRQSYYQQREAQLKASFDAELRALEESTKLQLAQLEQQKLDAENTRNQMLEDAKLKARENLNVVESGQQQAINVLQSKNQDYYRSGQTLGNMFAHGLESSASRVKEAANKIAKVVSSRLELHSPAKEGPLSTLNKWWNAFSDTILEGLDTRAINSAVNAMVNPNLSFSSLGAVGARAMASTSSVKQEYNFERMFEGANFVIRDEQDIRSLGREFGSYIVNSTKTTDRARGRK